MKDFKVVGNHNRKSILLDGIECFGSPHFIAWSTLITNDLEVLIAKHARKEPDWYNHENEEWYFQKGRYRFYKKDGSEIKLFSKDIKYPRTLFSYKDKPYIVYSDGNNFTISEDGHVSRLFGSPWKRFVNKIELDELFVFADIGDGLKFLDVKGKSYDLFGKNHHEYMSFINIDDQIYLPASDKPDGDIELYSADGRILDKDRLPIHSPNGILFTLDNGKIKYEYDPRQGVLYHLNNNLPLLVGSGDKVIDRLRYTNFKVFDFRSD